MGSLQVLPLQVESAKLVEVEEYAYRTSANE